MTFGILCSGQGLQSATMFTLTGCEAAAVPIFEEAAEHLGCDPRRLVAEMDEPALYENLTGQILCVTQALTAYACIKEAVPARLVVAGYSVGEMAAWSIAGVWTSRELLSLVHVRANLMNHARKPGDCLAAVRGLDRSLVTELCKRHHCEIGIINPDRLFVVGGARLGIFQLCKEALLTGATRASVLAVNIASHTSRMEKAIAPFQLAIDSAHPRPLAHGKILLSASNGMPIAHPALESSKLANQLASQLDWAACLEAMAEANVDRILELGPGESLASMARSISLFSDVRALDDFRTAEGVRRWIMRP